ncbi:MAG: hypothetical protein L0Z62_04550, partial [Gemmataceae bacterium]|nr:hypothetical protein [Gemmataceae bacterium]
MQTGIPDKQGLYDPQYEHDSCGVGFVVDMKGRRSHDLVEKGIQVLLNLEHRGACGCEKNTGDGAGILLQSPHRFLLKAADTIGVKLPAPGEYAAGVVFLPTDRDARARCEGLFEQVVREEGQHVLGWRDVPIDDSPIGPTAKAAMPVVRMIFIGRGSSPLAPGGRGVGGEGVAKPQAAGGEGDPMAFERKLYVIRKRVDNAIRDSDIPHKKRFYVLSLSFKTLVYKGMLNSDQLALFYPELHDPDMETALAMVLLDRSSAVTPRVLL